jgi:hypothetical protein
MTSLLHKTLLLFFLSLSSCIKEGVAEPQVQLLVKNGTTTVEWEHIEGSWMANQKDLFINANGCQNELFKLYLPGAKDTGTYKEISSRNIYFSDAQEIPPKAAKGYIRITHVDAYAINGNFEVTLESSNSPQADVTLGGSFSLKYPK